MNQYQKIIKLLEEAGQEGINSWDSRSTALQLPARIYYLKRAPYGLDIQTVRNPHPRSSRDTSVNYILNRKAKPKTMVIWNKDGTGRVVTEEEYNQIYQPEQLTLNKDFQFS